MEPIEGAAGSGSACGGLGPARVATLPASAQGRVVETQLGDGNMLHWALVFLVVAIIAAVLGFTGIAGAATNIAWILFVVGLVVALVFFLSGRRGV